MGDENSFFRFSLKEELNVIYYSTFADKFMHFLYHETKLCSYETLIVQSTTELINQLILLCNLIIVVIYNKKLIIIYCVLDYLLSTPF